VQALIVTANGSPIGYLTGVSQYTYLIYDDVNDVLFSVNNTTGNVAGSGATFYDGAECTGSPFTYVTGDDADACALFGDVNQANVVGSDNDFNGITEATSLWIDSGSPSIVTIASTLTSGVGCQSLGPDGFDYCVRALVETTVIPTSFETPIAIQAP
jgi:hypothetical protein